MSFGRKITQLKEAMTHILKDLNEDDLFNIVTFESTSLAWSKTMKKATPENTKEATEMVQGLFAEGGTSFMRGNMAKARNFTPWFCVLFPYFLSSNIPLSGRRNNAEATSSPQ